MNAIHMEVADYLMGMLIKREVIAGEKLPSEQVLAEKFHTTRINIRRTYERLMDMGYVVALPHNRGFVAATREKLPIDLGTCSRRIVDGGWEAYNRSLWQELNLHEAHQVQWELVRYDFQGKAVALRYYFVGDRRMGYVREQTRPSISPNFIEYLKSLGATKLIMGPCSWRVGHPVKAEREILGAKHLEPIMQVDQLVFNEGDGLVVAALRTLYRAATHQFIQMKEVDNRYDDVAQRDDRPFTSTYID